MHSIDFSYTEQQKLSARNAQQHNLMCKYTKNQIKISPSPLDTGFKNMFTSTYLKKKKSDGGQVVSA
jgi:hypothetical protein